MCLGGASAGILQTMISGLVQIFKRDETFNANEIANAVLGALVSVTGCCPFIDPPWAIVIGRKYERLVIHIVSCFHESKLPESLLGVHVSTYCKAV